MARDGGGAVRRGGGARPGRSLRSPLRTEATLDANDDAALLTLAGAGAGSAHDDITECDRFRGRRRGLGRRNPEEQDTWPSTSGNEQ